MNKGTYYIGDLSYVLENNKDILGIRNKNGKYILDNGGIIRFYSISLEERFYQDQFGQDYHIKNGNLGCIMIENIDYIKAELNHGQIIKFYDDFNVWNSFGRILFGHICIDTN